MDVSTRTCIVLVGFALYELAMLRLCLLNARSICKLRGICQSYRGYEPLRRGGGYVGRPIKVDYVALC